MKLEVLGCYAPSFSRKKTVSCYRLNLGEKVIYLDMGYYTYKKINDDDLEKMEIFISHNHVDHSYGAFQFMYKLDKHNVKLNNKVKIYMPEKSKFKNLFKAFNARKNVEAYAVTEDLKVDVENLEFSFCKTVHKGETYAIKIKNKENGKVFVYTADLAEVTDKLIDFCKDADCVMIEAGHSVNFQPFTLGKYHGYTKDLTKDILKANPKKVYITHYKGYATEKRIRKFLPKGKEELFTVVKIGDKLDIL